MKRLVAVFVVCALISFAVAVLAQAPPLPPPVASNAPGVATQSTSAYAVVTPKVPTLSEIDKLRVQNVMLRIELAQRQAQQAQTDFDKARAEAQALIQGLQVPGYDLDLQAFAYKLKAAEPPVAKK